MIREANKEDLQGLLQLYTQLHNNNIPEDEEGLHSLWEEILKDKNHHIILALNEDKIVSSCVLVVVPNLTRNQRPYGLIENVVTDENSRKKGFASACLNYAKELAQKENCYKLMLLTGAKEVNTLNFYEKAGYNKNDKTAFIQWL